MSDNTSEFEQRLEKLSNLYEEGKDCLHAIYNPDPRHARLYEILRELKDMAATQLQTIHWQQPN